MIKIKGTGSLLCKDWKLANSPELGQDEAGDRVGTAREGIFALFETCQKIRST